MSLVGAVFGGAFAGAAADPFCEVLDADLADALADTDTFATGFVDAFCTDVFDDAFAADFTDAFGRVFFVAKVMKLVAGGRYR